MFSYLYIPILISRTETPDWNLRYHFFFCDCILLKGSKKFSGTIKIDDSNYYEDLPIFYLIFNFVLSIMIYNTVIRRAYVNNNLIPNHH